MAEKEFPALAMGWGGEGGCCVDNFGKYGKISVLLLIKYARAKNTQEK